MDTVGCEHCGKQTPVSLDGLIPASHADSLERERDEYREKYWKALQAERENERLRGAGNGLADLWSEIAPGFLPDRYNDLVDERTNAWKAALEAEEESK